MNIFKIVLPGNNTRSSRVKDDVVNSLYPNPKIDVTAHPPHAGVIFIQWNDTSDVPAGTTRLIYSFPHGYNSIPTALASFTYQSTVYSTQGVFPFQQGALGMFTIDTDDKNVNIKYYSFELAATPMDTFIMKIRFYVMAEHGYD